MKLERKNSRIIFFIFGVVFVLNSLSPVIELLYIKAKGESTEAKIVAYDFIQRRSRNGKGSSYKCVPIIEFFDGKENLQVPVTMNSLSEELDIIGLNVKVSYLKNTPSKVIIDDKLFWLYEISNSLVFVGSFLLIVMLSQMSVETYRGRELTFDVPTKNKIIFLISGLPGVIGTFLSFYYGFITLKYNGLGFTSGTLILSLLIIGVYLFGIVNFVKRKNNYWG
ncbi:DUF3592 domain-containing protein [Clostridium sp.]|uniref:DUF3592 domain-containing protein n=1 Tax=Clostridium sp. TaxID=1506 RepID=UPI002612F82D